MYCIWYVTYQLERFTVAFYHFYVKITNIYSLVHESVVIHWYVIFQEQMGVLVIFNLKASVSLSLNGLFDDVNSQIAICSSIVFYSPLAESISVQFCEWWNTHISSWLKTLAVVVDWVMMKSRTTQ